jgi:TRAP-type C4-dicarboxylate transport system permease small subunit
MTNTTSKPSKSKTFRQALRITAGVIFLGAFAFWFSTGSHTGWSKNRVEVSKTDPITEIEYIEYEDRFVMGVEYLGLATASALALAALSLFVGRRTKPQS